MRDETLNRANLCYGPNGGPHSHAGSGGTTGRPVVTGGLVNVTIVDAIDVNRNTVQLPIAVAANVYDVDINVLAADLADDGQANCTAEAGSRANNG